jgi:hypothetical protein
MALPLVGASPATGGGVAKAACGCPHFEQN